MPASTGIGLLNEKPLHAALKAWVARPGDRLESPVDGFVVDIVRGDQLIEIQTRNFGALKVKLTALLASRPVRLVHPIAHERWIVRPGAGADDRPLRRKSPARGRWEMVFEELVSLPHLLCHERFTLEVVLTREEEVRRFEGRRQWRRRGWAIDERRLIDVAGTRLFRGPADWRASVPAHLSSFTTADLASELGIRQDLAQKMAYCLHRGGVTELLGRRGRARLYRLLPGDRTTSASGAEAVLPEPHATGMAGRGTPSCASRASAATDAGTGSVAANTERSV
ncbi:MAG: hypothetical protein R2712_14960 [Vicinamibacterales bacterium]